MEYKCPNCKSILSWDANNPNRPFCSERCKNIDFVEWANEKNRLPEIGMSEELDEFY